MGPDGEVEYMPIGQATRAAAQAGLGGGSGHAATIVEARWYPSDTGAFLTAGTDGRLSVWDTSAMEAVATFRPFPRVLEPQRPTVSRFERRGLVPEPSVDPTGPLSISCMDVSGLRANSIVVGSGQDETVRLVDVRSGAASHSLVGHRVGIASVRWSPISPYVVASGGRDCCWRLWDIRKSGSGACLAIADQHRQVKDPLRSRAYRPPHYAQMRPPRLQAASQGKRLAPNDYAEAEQKHVVTSADKPIYRLAFDPTGQFLVASDSSLSVWDLRSNQPQKMTRRFVSPRGSTNLGSQAPLCISSDGGESTVWVGHSSTLLGYSLEGGGKPRQVLKGHLSSLTALTAVETTMQLVSAADDGLLLMWGPMASNRDARKRKERTDQDNW